MVADLLAKIGGIAPFREDYPEEGFDPDAILTPKDQRTVDRFVLFGLAAAKWALAEAG